MKPVAIKKPMDIDTANLSACAVIFGSWLPNDQALFKTKLKEAETTKAIVFATYLLTLTFSLKTYSVLKSTTNAEKPTTANLNIFSISI